MFAEILKQLLLVLNGLITLLNTCMQFDQRKSVQTAEAIINASYIEKDKKELLLRIIRRCRNLTWGLVILIILFCMIALFFGYSLIDARSQLFKALRTHDPMVFNTSNSEIELARVLPGRSDVMENSPFSTILKSTDYTFDLIALNGYTTFDTNGSDIESAIKRGVRFRFVFMDTRAENKLAFDSMAAHVDQDADALRRNSENALTIAMRIKSKIDLDHTAYPGDIEVRWLKGPLIYSAWIKDRGREGAVSQIGIYSYSESSKRPFVKVGKDAITFTNNITAEFELLWSRSTQWVAGSP